MQSHNLEWSVKFKLFFIINISENSSLGGGAVGKPEGTKNVRSFSERLEQELERSIFPSCTLSCEQFLPRRKTLSGWGFWGILPFFWVMAGMHFTSHVQELLLESFYSETQILTHHSVVLCGPHAHVSVCKKGFAVHVCFWTFWPLSSEEKALSPKGKIFPRSIERRIWGVSRSLLHILARARKCTNFLRTALATCSDVRICSSPEVHWAPRSRQSFVVCGRKDIDFLSLRLKSSSSSYSSCSPRLDTYTKNIHIKKGGKVEICEHILSSFPFFSWSGKF